MQSKNFSSTTPITCNCETISSSRCGFAREKTLRWSDLAAGSVVGIAAWAALYVLGAGAAALGCAGEELGWGRAIYGAVAASLALGLGSGAASLSHGKTSVLLGALYGCVMWGMAAITLVTVTGLLSSGAWGDCPPPLRGMLQVGAAAVGFDDLTHARTVPLYGTMGGVLVLSLAAAVVGGCRGANHSRR